MTMAVNEALPLAGRQRGRARVGCSGWSYRDWCGPVYPEGLASKRWFGHYTSLFDTVELNSTFYRLPTTHAVDGWAAAAPPGFVFAMKLGQFGSHRMKLRDARSWLPNHVERAERLATSCGPTLVQLPPNWRRNTERLDEFLTIAPRTIRWAVEVRDPSWLDDDVYEVLHRHGAALCIHDLIKDHPFVMTTDWTYVRLHGPDALHDPYRGSYGSIRLTQWAMQMCVELERGHDVYCYFNNDYDGLAVADAQWLRHVIEQPDCSA